VHALVEFSLANTGTKSGKKAREQAELGVRWILASQLDSGGWTSCRDTGVSPILDTTFNAVRALVSYARLARKVGDEVTLRDMARALRRHMNGLGRRALGWLLP